MSDMNIGIIGLGYVGSAVKEYFEDKVDIFTYDINSNCSEKDIKSIYDKSEIIFICVPTPMNKNGSCDLSNIESILSELNFCANKIDDKIIVIKSTIPVGSTKKFQTKYINLEICFNPEFLREVSFKEDFANQDRIILGGKHKKTKVYNLYKKFFNQADIIETDSSTAEMVKYITNTFLALKVSFANEMSEFCVKNDIEYNQMIKFACLDKRLGDSHWMVPGPDGLKGYGGSCFPKDINSLIYQFKISELDPLILKASWERNCKIDRTKKDWEKLKGRSVSYDK